ncbi:MAG: gamma carboxylase [Acidimicrobiia bacterium]|nr:gamma carboxylase [Acidimicrobiia bacterium]
MVVGLVTVLSAARLIGYGWVGSRYAGPRHRFTYPGLGWVPRPSVELTTALVLLVGLAGLLVAFGWRYRLAMAVLVAGFTWLEALDATTYLNHYWFLTLLGGLLVLLPADAALSLPARRDGPRPVPLAAVWLVRYQVAVVVYAFAALAKAHGDWLVHGLPLRLWLPARADRAPLAAGLLTEPWAGRALSVAGFAFDALVVALLLWRRSRPWAFLAVVLFHLVTWRLFAIGVFPWLMIGAATVFFDPSWPRRARHLWPGRRSMGRWRAGGGAQAAVGSAAARPAAVAAVGLWAAAQLAPPLRHWLYPGDARWTGEGYRLAWNVLAVEKSGTVMFRPRDPGAGTSWRDDARSLYTPEQWRVMATEPDLIHQAALELARQARGDGHGAVEVRVDAFVSFNGRALALQSRWEGGLAAVGPAPDVRARGGG